MQATVLIDVLGFLLADLSDSYQIHALTACSFLRRQRQTDRMVDNQEEDRNAGLILRTVKIN